MHVMDEVPKHTAWSPRGELAIGAGSSYRTYPGFHDSGPLLEPWEIDFDDPDANIQEEKSFDKHSKGRTSRPQSRMEDSIPANRRLNLVESSLTGGGSLRSRPYSPSSSHRFPTGNINLRETTVQGNLGASSPHGDGSQTPRKQISVPLPDTAVHLPNKGRRRDLSRSASRGRKHLLDSDAAGPPVIEGDISMLMRSRAMQGYGLTNVRLLF